MSSPTISLAPVLQPDLDANFATEPAVSSTDWTLVTGSSEYIPESNSNEIGTEFQPTMPAISGGALQLTLQTFNPPPGGTDAFYGSQIVSKDAWAPVAGTGIAYTAVAKLDQPYVAGLDAGIFAYQVSAPQQHDEADFELLSSLAPSDAVQTNAYLNAPTNSIGNAVTINGYDPTAWETYTIEWFPNALLWFINGKLVQATTNNVPQQAMAMYLNFWVIAGNPGLIPVTSKTLDTTNTFSVQSAEVDTVQNLNTTLVFSGTQANQTTSSQATITPFTNVALTDLSAAVPATLTVTLSNAANGTLSNLGNGAYDPTSGVYTDTGTAASLTADLDALIFSPNKVNIPSGEIVTTSFTIAANDATGAIASDSTTSVRSVAPTLSAGQVTILGATNQTLSFQFPDTTSAAVAATAVAPINTALAASQTGELIAAAGGSFAITSGTSVAAVTASAPVTISGGAANGQFVIAGAAGLAFNAGAGAGSVFATGGNNLVGTYASSGAQYIQLGNGNDTIVALAANDTIIGGSGSNQILTGAGNDIVNTNGTDLIAAGALGAATITAGANNPTVFLGPGTSVFNGGTGHATIVGGTGADTINAQGNTQIWLGTKTDNVTTTGADTIIGSTGAATVNASASSFLFAGSGKLNFIETAGAQTILGAASSAMSLQGGAGSVIALSYGETQFTGGSGAATIAGFAGSLTIHGGAGSGLYLAGTAGNNSITGGAGQSIILGTAAGDVLTAGTGAGDVIEAGAGAETINAAASTGKEALYGGTGSDVILTGSGSTNVLLGTGATTLVAGSGTDLFAFTAGHANTVTIQNFQNFASAHDYLSLVGFASGAAATALAGATVANGSEQITLLDGTHITFQGFTGLTAANFL